MRHTGWEHEGRGVVLRVKSGQIRKSTGAVVHCV